MEALQLLAQGDYIVLSPCEHDILCTPAATSRHLMCGCNGAAGRIAAGPMSTWSQASQCVCMLCSLPCQGKFEREAAELKENSAQAMKEQGDTLLRQGNFEGAVNAYDRALDLDGSLTPVLGNRAICKLKLKQYRCVHC